MKSRRFIFLLIGLLVCVEEEMEESADTAGDDA
jgi:hypothetical protein